MYSDNALSPARVTRVNIVDADARLAQVIVPDYQLSLAIGKEGQNARLAHKLTGWKIDIHSDNPGGNDSAGRRPAGDVAWRPRASRQKGGMRWTLIVRAEVGPPRCCPRPVRAHAAPSDPA